MIDLDKLELLVKALKPCQWEVAHPNAGGRGWEVKQGIDQIAADMTEERARYIAAVNPVVVLELIADARRSNRIQVAMVLALTNIGEALGLSPEEQENGEEELIEAINQLKAEVERLKADLDGELGQARDFNIEHAQLQHDHDKWESLYRNEHAAGTRLLDTLTGVRTENEKLRAEVKRLKGVASEQG
jgi:hypothetical protein